MPSLRLLWTVIFSKLAVADRIFICHDALSIASSKTSATAIFLPTTSFILILRCPLLRLPSAASTPISCHRQPPRLFHAIGSLHAYFIRPTCPNHRCPIFISPFSFFSTSLYQRYPRNPSQQYHIRSLEYPSCILANDPTGAHCISNKQSQNKKIDILNGFFILNRDSKSHSVS